MSDIKIVIAADVASADAGLKKVQTELSRTAIEAQKVDSRLQGFGTSVQNAAGKTGLMTSAASSLKSNLLSMISPTQLLVSGIVAMGVALYAYINRTTEAEKNTAKFVEVVGKAGSVFTKASLDVQSLRDEIDSFGKGIGSKDDIVKHFNETLGKAVGKVTSLEQAEKSLNANAEAYVYSMTAKAVANAAYAESYDIIFKYLKNTIESERIIAEIRKSGRKLINGGNEVTSKQSSRLEQIKKENEELKKTIDILAETKNRALDIYNKVAEKLERNKKSSVIVGPLQKSEIEVKELKVKPEKVKVENTGKIEFSDDKEALKLPVEFDFKSAMDINKSGAFRPFLDLVKKSTAVPIQTTGAIDPFFINLEKKREALKEFANIATSVLSPAFDSLFENIGKGTKSVIKGLGLVIKELTIAVFKALALYTIKALITGGGSLGKDFLGGFFKSFFGGGKASGSTAGKGGMTLVGERGPELVNLPSGSSVMPNNQLQAFGNGGINLMPSIAYDGTMFRIFLNRVDAQISRNG